MPYAKGTDRRALLLVKVPKGHEEAAVRELTHHMSNQQWRDDWSIKRVEAADLDESRRLGRFAPPAGPVHNVFVAVKARNRATLVNKAIPAIHRALGATATHAHVLVHSFGVDF